MRWLVPFVILALVGCAHSATNTNDDGARSVASDATCTTGAQIGAKVSQEVFCEGDRDLVGGAPARWQATGAAETPLAEKAAPPELAPAPEIPADLDGTSEACTPGEGQTTTDLKRVSKTMKCPPAKPAPEETPAPTDPAP